MRLRSLLVVSILFITGFALAADGKLTVKVEDAPPPKEFAEPIRNLLDSKALTVSDGAGKVLCTVWPRKGLETKAGATGRITYNSFDETTVFGAIRFPDTWSDFRKYKIKPGLFTMRLSIQPMDGDHMGTAPYNEFCLLAPAALDTKPDLMEAMELHELSMKATGRKHPGIVLLFPNAKPADAPAIESKPQETWVLSFKAPVKSAGKEGVLGFSLVLVGHTTAE